MAIAIAAARMQRAILRLRYDVRPLKAEDGGVQALMLSQSNVKPGTRTAISPAQLSLPIRISNKPPQGEHYDTIKHT